MGLVLGLLMLLGGTVDPAAASFADRVDYTLTNQSGQDFHGQQLAESSFAGAVAREADFSGADLHGSIFTQGSFAMSNFSGADLSDVLMDRVNMGGTNLRAGPVPGTDQPPTRRRKVFLPSCSTLPWSSAALANIWLGSRSFLPSSLTPPSWILRLASLLVTPIPMAPIR
ncbi:MAG: pentapeptide repeat-containing protein [Cyanobacteria bacterium]|nr:pentapeptide repeat-containing protein [Cyanobacteriota bacterium]